MKKIIIHLDRLSIWYGLTVILLYSLLLSEYISTINHFVLISIDEVIPEIYKIFLQISYFTIILSCIIAWIISTFLFHLMALLLNGQPKFKNILFASSYLYIIPSLMCVVGIYILEEIDVPSTESFVVNLLNDPKFILSTKLVNYSGYLPYLFIPIIIRHICQIRYLYAVLSVAIPLIIIFLIAKLIDFI